MTHIMAGSLVWTNPILSRTLGVNCRALIGSTKVIETEVWTHGPGSLIVEFGGALGLFTGFSFYMFWDVLKFAVLSNKARILALSFK